MTTTRRNGEAVAPVTNGAAELVALTEPYVANVSLTGTSTLLFHRWNNEAVAEKAAAAKGSKAKKEDNVESYIWRDATGVVCLPGRYLVGAITDPRNGAAKYRQDPRSPRKSALDLYRAGVVPLTELAPITSAGKSAPSQDWDYLDSQRVMVQRQGVTRVRPAFLAGWTADVQLAVLTPEYVPPAALHDVLSMAGRLVGVGDFRPTYGRFAITRFDIGLAN
jgi:hypothetical protein